MAEPGGFFARWSRLKRAERERQPVEPAAAPEPPAEPAPELPPIDSLTRDSDFTLFLRPGVPEELRKQALRKLWSSDPVFANLDGLVEYGEDFAAPFQFAGAVATVYRVLEGMPDPQPAAEEQAAADVPADVGNTEVVTGPTAVERAPSEELE